MSLMIIHLITLQETSQRLNICSSEYNVQVLIWSYFRLWNDTRESSILTVDIFGVKLHLLILLNLLNMKTKKVHALALSLLANKYFLHLNFVIYGRCWWVWRCVLNVLIFQILHTWHLVRRRTMTISLSMYFWFSWALLIWFLSCAGSPLQWWTQNIAMEIWHDINNCLVVLQKAAKYCEHYGGPRRLFGLIDGDLA